MPILFSTVANGQIILEKCALCDGNFKEIAKRVLSKISTQNGKMTYFHGQYLLHYILEDNTFYFCITDKMCQRSRAFLFLNEIRRRFKLNKADFQRVLMEEMYRYNEDESTIIIRKGDLDELNNIGVGSSESILGDKILHVENNHDLRYSAISYVDKPWESLITSSKEPKLRYFSIITLICLGVSATYIVSPSILVLLTGIYLLFSTIAR